MLVPYVIRRKCWLLLFVGGAIIWIGVVECTDSSAMATGAPSVEFPRPLNPPTHVSKPPRYITSLKWLLIMSVCSFFFLSLCGELKKLPGGGVRPQGTGQKRFHVVQICWIYCGFLSHTYTHAHTRNRVLQTLPLLWLAAFLFIY